MAEISKKKSSKRKEKASLSLEKTLPGTEGLEDLLNRCEAENRGKENQKINEEKVNDEKTNEKKVNDEQTNEEQVNDEQTNDEQTNEEQNETLNGSSAVVSKSSNDHENIAGNSIPQNDVGMKDETHIDKTGSEDTEANKIMKNIVENQELKEGRIELNDGKMMFKKELKIEKEMTEKIERRVEEEKDERKNFQQTSVPTNGPLLNALQQMELTMTQNKQTPIYPQLSSSLISTLNPLEAHRVLEDTDTLRLPEEDTETYTDPIELITPFTPEQLNNLYYNPSLENVNISIQQFHQRPPQHQHELYRLIKEHQEYKQAYLRGLLDIQSTKDNIKQLKSLFWVFKSHTKTLSSKCMDNVEVQSVFKYETAERHDTTGVQATEALTCLTDLTLNHASSLAFKTQLSRLLIENYLFKFFLENPLLTNIPPNLPPQFLQSRDAGLNRSIVKLKELISVLFSLLTNPPTQPPDAIVEKDIKIWLSNLTACLLRHSTSQDHLFILLHTLNLPHQHITTALPFIQAPDIGRCGDDMKFDSASFNHNITQVAMIFSFVKYSKQVNTENAKRSEMENGRADRSPSESREDWILVDSDGEDDVVMEGGRLREKDVLSLYGQVGLADVLKYLIVKSEENFRLSEVIYSMTEYQFLKLMAFSHRLVDIVGGAMKTFDQSASSRMNKKLGQVLKKIVEVLCHAWMLYKLCFPHLAEDLRCRVQLECDVVLLKAVLCVLEAPNTGAWQFLSYLPYQGISSPSLWNLLRLLHTACWRINALYTPLLLPASKCKEYLLSDQCTVELTEKLLLLSASDATFLITTLAHVACVRGGSDCSGGSGSGGVSNNGGGGGGGGVNGEDEEVVNFLIKEIFHVSFLNTSTRDQHSKLGTQLLHNICTHHPSTFPLLLQLTITHIQAIGSVSYQLFKSLPLTLWSPFDLDLSLIEDWLLRCDLNNPTNHLVRIILERLDWRDLYQNKEEIIVDNLAKGLAHTLMRVYEKHIDNCHKGNYTPPTSLQVLPLLSFPFSLRQTPTPSEAVKKYLQSLPPPPSSSPSSSSSSATDINQMHDWLWCIAISLPLHSYARYRLRQPLQHDSDHTNRTSYSHTNHTDHTNHHEHFTDNHQLTEFQLSLFKTSKGKHPFKCYFAFQLSPLGYSCEELLSGGMELMGGLIPYSPALLSCLSCVLHPFYDNPEAAKVLLGHPGFKACLESLLNEGEGVSAESSSSSSGSDQVDQMTGLILSHLDTHKDSETAYKGCLQFWLSALTNLPWWFHNTKCIVLLDSVLMASVHVDKCMSVSLQFFTALLMEIDMFQLLSSLPSSSSSSSSFFSGLSKIFKAKSERELFFSSSKIMKSQVWLRYILLKAETRRCEMDGGLMEAMEGGLRKDLKVSVNDVFQQLIGANGPASIYKPPPSTTPTPATHYLSIYRGLQLIEDTPCSHPLLPLLWFHFLQLFFQRPSNQCSQGHRYFEGVLEGGLLKGLRKKCAGVVVSLRQMLVAVSDQNSQKALLYRYLISLHESIDLWLDETRLHDNTLNLSGLPSQYQPHLFLTLLQNNMVKWSLYYIDYEAILTQSRSIEAKWILSVIQAKLSCQSRHNKSIAESSKIKSPYESLSFNLTYKQPNNHLPPPSFQPIPSILPYSGRDLLLDQQKLQILVQSDLKNIEEFAKYHAQTTEQHSNSNKRIMASLYNLYANVETESVTTVHCKSFISITHSCKSPAIFRLRHPVKHLNDIVSRQLHLEEEHSSQLITYATQIPSSSACIPFLRLQIIILQLIRAFQESSNERLVFEGVGRSLFYSVLSAISVTTDVCPPTKHHLLSCLNLLGNVFILNSQSEASKLLLAANHNSSHAHLLITFFNPQSNPNTFVQLYAQVVESSKLHKAAILHCLLSKFQIDQWLSTSNSAIKESAFLLDIIFRSLSFIGPKPSNEMQDIHKLQREHLVTLCKRVDLNTHLINSLLSASENSGLSPNVWEDLLTVIGYSSANQVTADDNFEFVLRDDMLPYIHKDKVMEWVGVLVGFMQSQVNTFHQHCSPHQHSNAVSEKMFKKFWLYTKWHLYIAHLCKVFYCVLSLLYKSVEVFIGGVEEDQRERTLDLAFNTTQHLFQPWVEWAGGLQECWSHHNPLLTTTLPHLSSMLASWCRCLANMHHLFKRPSLSTFPTYNNGEGILNRVWCFYVKHLGVGSMPDHVVDVYNGHVVTLPWRHFQPTPACIHYMMETIHFASPCFELTGNIFSLINWKATLDQYRASLPSSPSSYSTSSSFQNLHRMHECIFVLMTKLSCQKGIVENTQLTELTSSEDTFDWQTMLTSTTFASYSASFADETQDLAFLLNLDATSKHHKILKLFINASQFYPSTTSDNNQQLQQQHYPQLHQQQQQYQHHVMHERHLKRISYVALIIKLLTRASYISNASNPLHVSIDNLGVTLNNLTSQLDALLKAEYSQPLRSSLSLSKLSSLQPLSSQPPPHSSSSQSLSSPPHSSPPHSSPPHSSSQHSSSPPPSSLSPFCTELWSLLNNCNDASALHFSAVLRDWISGSIFSDLLTPLISSACTSIHSPHLLTPVIETYLDTHFSLDVRKTDDNGWKKVLATLNHPPTHSLPSITNQALLDGHFFTVHAFILYRLSLCQSMNEEMDVLVMLVDLTTSAKPHEENESKLFLWWHKILQLCCKQLTDFPEQLSPSSPSSPPSPSFSTINSPQSSAPKSPSFPPSHSVKSLILQLTSTLVSLGEDKSAQGLFGVLGLGRRSVLSLRFRVVANGLAAYLASILRRDFNCDNHHSEDSLSTMLKKTSKLTTQQLSQQTSSRINQMASDRTYNNYKQQVMVSVEICKDESLSLFDYETVMSRLVMPLFSEGYHLGMIFM